MDYFVFPDFNPVAIALGPLVVRWYALAYLVGFIIGWRVALKMADRTPAGLLRAPTRTDVDDFLTWAVLGVVLGGRLGYVLFYNAPHYLSHPAQIFHIWEGGMSFHGGLLGMATACLIYCAKRGLNPLALGDILATVAPIGLGLGRLANFVNGELVGRPTDVSWAVIFPKIDQTPRHPSQLYEAALEGLLLFAIVYGCSRIEGLRRRPGMIFGIFLCLYAAFRAFAEEFRTPDIQLGFIVGNTTMGQLLCIPMFLIGLWLLVRAGFVDPNKANAEPADEEAAASDNDEEKIARDA